ncbi:HK97 gp10 family phage protein [Subtercola vilae]|nr:HK97 gp10 family phage protein [Subtercola vilae]
MVGVSELYAAFAKVAADSELASRLIVAKGAAMVEREAKANFQGSHKRDAPHVGGSLPNVVSGDLRRSIISTPVVRTGAFSYSAMVGPTTVYGRRVELGMNGSKGYPYFHPAVQKVKPLLSAMAVSTWRETLRI